MSQRTVTTRKRPGLRRKLAGAATALLTATAFLGIGAVTFTASPARAAISGEVTNFGSNPGNLRMFQYVPTNVQPNPPVVVVMHGCGGSASGLDVNTGWRKFADAWGFVLVLPEQKQENAAPQTSFIPTKCFNAWNREDRTHDGNGEARSIVQMVEYMKTRYNADPKRVFATGYSGGGAFTNVLLAAYPDVFAAGAVFFGMPYACADTYQAYFTVGGPCSGSASTRTPAQWGELIRTGYPGYTGPRPKVQIWHGSNDSIISPKSMDFQRDQWTAFFGISQQPTSTSTPAPGVTKKVYGTGQVETWLVNGMGHQVPVDPGSGISNCGQILQGYDSVCGAYHAARFFGLGESSPQPPSPGGGGSAWEDFLAWLRSLFGR
mgnify:CR=1 FL=1